MNEKNSTENSLAIFDEIAKELREIYRTKNISYGNSFGDSIREFGIISSVTRIDDKWNRIKNMVKGGQNLIKDESMEDNFKDIANYCIMTLMEFKKNTVNGDENE